MLATNTNGSGLFSRVKTSSNVSVQSVTLPITCQICLSKVKDPCVCPNLHVFCAICIELWLEKTKQCPSCRILISKENPCRRILGGIENVDEEALKPTEFSHPSTRKARHLSLYQQYEDEMTRLERQVESLESEVAKFKEASKNLDPDANMMNGTSVSSGSYDMIQMLKTKLEQVQSVLDETIAERDKYRDMAKKSESENCILIQDIARLKSTLCEKSAQLTSKYTVAALESKLDSYEKEIKQLQKALECSDKYTSELESRLNGGRPISPPQRVITSNEVDDTTQVKSVKFVDKPESVSSTTKVTPPPLTSNRKTHSSSSSASTSRGSSRVILIPNERFYGSPSKTPTSASKSSHVSHPTPSISSFAERMKKNAPSSSFNNNSNETDSTKDQQTTPPSCQNSMTTAQSFLFSPMKRLRLDEANDQVSRLTSMSSFDRIDQPSMFQSEAKSPMKKASSTLGFSADLNDCMHILNEAEKKVKSRESSMSPSKTSSSIYVKPNVDKFTTNQTMSTNSTASCSAYSSIADSFRFNRHLNSDSGKLLVEKNSCYANKNPIYAKYTNACDESNRLDYLATSRNENENIQFNSMSNN